MKRREWNKYVTRLSAINQTAGRKMQEWIDRNGTDNVEAMVQVAYALTAKYGEAASATACEMYDEIAVVQNAHVPPAEPKAPQHINYVDKAVRSTLDRAPGTVPDTVSEMVKRTGAETTLKNAKRDGAYFAWVPNGDTCAFCMILASNGWRRASKKTIDGDHAEHIHKHCDCEFAISFNGPGEIEGYDPDKYLAMYEGAEGDNWKDKMNSMRRDHYAANKDKINTQKREAYVNRMTKTESEKELGLWKRDNETDGRKYRMMIRGDGDNEVDFDAPDPRELSKREKDDLVSYATERGLNIHGINHFDGNPEVLKSFMDELYSHKGEMPRVFSGKRITLAFTDEKREIYAITDNKTIYCNRMYFRDRSYTEESLRSSGRFVNPTIEGLARHELGHIVENVHGEKGLQFARKVYYNIYKEFATEQQLIAFVRKEVSYYAYPKLRDEITRDVYLSPHEITSEILSAKKESEFIRQMKDLWRKEVLR